MPSRTLLTRLCTSPQWHQQEGTVNLVFDTRSCQFKTLGAGVMMYLILGSMRKNQKPSQTIASWLVPSMPMERDKHGALNSPEKPLKY